MKTYLITFSYYIPSRREYQYRETASNMAAAVSRAIKKLRKERIGRKRLTELSIKVTKV